MEKQFRPFLSVFYKEIFLSKCAIDIAKKVQDFPEDSCAIKEHSAKLSAMHVSHQALLDLLDKYLDSAN